MNQDQQRIIRAVRRVMNTNIVVLDTETTGLHQEAEIVEISCIDRHGHVLLDTLVKPQGPLHPEASAVNGITQEDLEDQPLMAVVMDKLEPILAQADIVASYNLEFDHRMLRQSVGPAYQLPAGTRPLCIMKAYAIYQGEWDDWFESYRWHTLAAAMEASGARNRATPHGSLQNALGALAVLQHMAKTPDPREQPSTSRRADPG